MIDEILETIIALMQPLTTLTIRQAALPVGDGICLEAGAAGTVTTHLDRATLEQMSCVMNAKCEDLQTARGTLTVLHHYLTRMATYPQNDDWQITDITTIGGPSVVSREPNGMWIVGSQIRVTYYDKEREQ